MQPVTYLRLTRRVEFVWFQAPWCGTRRTLPRVSWVIRRRSAWGKQKITLDFGTTIATLSRFPRSPRRQRKNRAILHRNMLRDG